MVCGSLPFLDVIIRSVRENNNRISNKLTRLYPVLAEKQTIAEHICHTVMEAFSNSTGNEETS